MAMKVKDLIEELKECDPEAVVVAAIDGEGNSYNVCDGVWEGKFDASGREVGYAELDDELREAGYGEGDIMRGGVAAVIVDVG